MANKELKEENLQSENIETELGAPDPVLTREQELEDKVKELTDKNGELFSAYQTVSVKYNKLFDLYADLLDKYLGNVRKQ